jgi:hypothetical protein
MLSVSSRLLAALALAGPAAGPVPPPAALPARVIVSGRTSTAVEVKVVRVGTNIPVTYSGARVKNTPGFVWYVSRHYALKTDYPEAIARNYLTLLELAYPHYVELFGREPLGIAEKRMAVVYASSAAQLKKALASDGLAWNFGGGGITYEGYNCAYQYPSGSLLYHQRYILLHECTHLFQICLTGNFSATPAWFFEGVADALGHHVYDPKKQQLTVNVLDKPTIANYLDAGLARHRREPLSFEKAHKGAQGGREAFFLMVHYLSDDPGRLQKFRVWRDEMFRANLYGKHQELSGRLLQGLFGPWKKLDADFHRWLAARKNTFHYVDWGWEQEGNTLWSYGFAGGGKLSRTDVLLPPGERPAYDPLRMDYPAPEVSPLVGKVERGGAEPAVGCLIDFSRNPRHGRAGIGLGVDDRKGGPGKGKGAAPGMLRLLVERGAALVLDGADLGLGRKEVPLPADLLKAMAAGGHVVGLNARIGARELEVTLRAGAVVFQASLPLTPEARARLLARPLALLARDGYHGLTPFFDDRRRPEPDLAAPAPANRWRNPGDRELGLLYRASWRLGGNGPASLKKLREAMTAAGQGPEEQRQALEALRKGIAAVRADVAKCGATREAIARALADLDGVGAASRAAPAAPHGPPSRGGPTASSSASTRPPPAASTAAPRPPPPTP